MKHLELTRSYLPDRTIGQIVVGGVAYCTLERPWFDNAINISCIPEGTYHVARDFTGKHRFYAVKYVQGRTNIEIHIANKVSELAGCIALGEFFNDEYELLNSSSALGSFLGVMGNESFVLTIRGFNPAIDKWSK